ncbi:hypothetical protein GCM10027176_48920 [Actinoallomurus bryophytorum]
MVVPVVAVLDMTVAVVHVVDVVLVRDRDMPAVDLMLVLMPVMRHVLAGLALIDVSLMGAMEMTIVCVVDMVLVAEGHMTAARPMLVCVIGMRAVLGRTRHVRPLVRPWHTPQRTERDPGSSSRSKLTARSNISILRCMHR